MEQLISRDIKAIKDFTTIAQSLFTDDFNTEATLDYVGYSTDGLEEHLKKMVKAGLIDNPEIRDINPKRIAIHFFNKTELKFIVPEIDKFFENSGQSKSDSL